VSWRVAGEPEGSRRDCNTMEKQRSGRVYNVSDVEEVIVIYCYKCSLICAKKKLKLALPKRS
jgi:hypothetical protein